MNNKSIYRSALALAIPMMIQSGITNAVGLVDNIMVGSLGTESMTAVSIVGQLFFVFNLAIFGGLSGPGIYGAQYFGKGDMEGFRNVFRIKWWICSVCSLVGIFIFLNFGTELINLYMSDEGETVLDAALTLKHAQDYLNIMLITIPAFAVTQIYANTLREAGFSISPMVAGLVSVVTDIVFNYCLIYGEFGFPRLEVRGAAIATAISRFVECAVLVFWAHLHTKRFTFLKGIYRTILVPAQVAKKVIIKGFPIFLNEFTWAGGIAVLTQTYARRSMDILPGLNISNALCNLMNVVFIAMGHAVGILVGQMLGASKFEKAKKDSVKLMWFTGAMCAVLTVVLIGLSGLFPKLYNTTAEIRNMSSKFIIITALFFPLQGFLNALYFTLRSGGRTVITFLFDSCYSWVVSVSLAVILVSFTPLSIFAIYTAVQAADIIKVVVGYILIKKGIWITNLVSE